MNWNDVRYLEALARHDSVAAVAREMAVAPSTVYRCIARLEAALDAPCIVRGTDAVVLTPAGRVLVTAARNAQAEFAKAQAMAKASQASASGRVSLTTIVDFLPFLVAPIAQVRQAHSELEIEVYLADDGPSVRRREVDLSIAVIQHPPDGLVGRRLAPVSYGVYGTREAVERRPHRWVVSGKPRLYTPDARWEREHAGEVAVITGNPTAHIAFLRAGLGIGRLPRRLARLEPTLVEVESYREHLAEYDRDVWLLYHPDARHTARVRIVCDALYTALAGGEF
ncbi:MAG: LysR family transcriptional regulator [Bradymonadia bacterium]